MSFTTHGIRERGTDTRRDTRRDVEFNALVKTLAERLAKVKAKTVNNTLGHVMAEVLVDTMADNGTRGKTENNADILSCVKGSRSRDRGTAHSAGSHASRNGAPETWRHIGLCGRQRLHDTTTDGGNTWQHTGR